MSTLHRGFTCLLSFKSQDTSKLYCPFDRRGVSGFEHLSSVQDRVPIVPFWPCAPLRQAGGLHRHTAYQEPGPPLSIPASLARERSDRNWFSRTSYNSLQPWYLGILLSTAGRLFLQNKVRLVPYCVDEKSHTSVLFVPCLCEPRTPLMGSLLCSFRYVPSHFPALAHLLLGPHFRWQSQRPWDC